MSIAPLLTEGEPPAYVSANDPTQGSKKRKARDGDDDDGLDGDGDVAEEEEEDGMFELPSDDDRGAEDETDFHPPPTPVAQLPLRPPARRGSVLITLRNTSPYTLWNIPLLAKRLPTVLPSILSSAPSLPKGQRAPSLPDAQRTRYALWRSFEFRPEMWRGYSHRRTVGWIEGVSTSNNEDILRGDAEDEALGGNAKGGKMNRIRGAKAAAGECRTWEFALDVNAIEGRANRQRPKAKGGR